MKKTVSIVLSCSIIVLMLVVLFANRKEHTLEQALNLTKMGPTTIIHQQEGEEGILVFVLKEERNSLYTAFVKKGLLGYETIYSSTQADIEKITEAFSISYTYFPAVKGMSLPICAGLIGNDTIRNIQVSDSKTSREAEIVETHDKHVWIVEMAGLEGTVFKIRGYNAQGEQVAEVEAYRS